MLEECKNFNMLKWIDSQFLLYFSPLATNRSSLSKDAALAASMDSIFSTKPLLSSATIDFNDDTDENKYKRRSAVTWFARWWRTTFGPTLRSRRTSQTQKYFLGFMIFLAIVTLLVIFHHYGRSGDDDYVGDPMLDPMNNPNIHVGHWTFFDHFLLCIYNYIIQFKHSRFYFENS